MRVFTGICAEIRTNALPSNAYRLPGAVYAGLSINEQIGFFWLPGYISTQKNLQQNDIIDDTARIDDGLLIATGNLATIHLPIYYQQVGFSH